MGISLRPICEADVDRIYAWVSNPWYIHEFAGSELPTRESHRAYYDRVLSGEANGKFFAVEFDGRHIGCAGIRYIQGRSGEIWYYIGDDSDRGKGCGREIVRTLCETALRDFGIEIISARVRADNIGSRRVLESNGFKMVDEHFGEFEGVKLLRYEKDVTP